MSLLLIAKNRDLTSLQQAILKTDPDLDVEVWPKVEHKERVRFAVCWNHPKHVLDGYPNLSVVSSLGAGINHLLNDEALPASAKICRLVTTALKDQVAEYIWNAITNYRLHFYTYMHQKNQGSWKPKGAIEKEEVPVGIMGLGEIGTAAAELLVKQGYSVSGWSRSKKELQGVTTFAGIKGLDDFFSATKILVCLLPLTDETEGILNLDIFKKIRKPGYLINVGRGSHLVEEDLIYALDTELLAGACLDVFEAEPLPEKHSFWNRENIMITPHVAGITPVKEAAELIIENYKRSLSGMELMFEIDREKGY